MNNDRGLLSGSITILIGAVIAIMALVRGPWQIWLLLGVFTLWGLWVVLILLLPYMQQAQRRRQRQQRTRQLHAEGIQTRSFEIPDLGGTNSDNLLVRHTNPVSYTHLDVYKRQLLTRPSENPALNINQDFLLERVLRKHPDVIGVGEMRSAAESLSAAESSRTGHTVCTTIHSNSCNSTYRRMMTLAKRKYNMDDSILMQIMVEAYPIIVFTKQLEDRSRKIMEIIEGEDYQDGRLIAHSLYKYEVEDNVTDDRGETRVVGHHKKIGLISDSLKKRLLDNGISNKELEEFMQPPKEVG